MSASRGRQQLERIAASGSLTFQEDAMKKRFDSKSKGLTTKNKLDLILAAAAIAVLLGIVAYTGGFFPVS